MKIVIDIRESEENIEEYTAVCNEIFKNPVIEKAVLEVGDILFIDNDDTPLLLCEIKHGLDLINSIVDGRIQRQSEALVESKVFYKYVGVVGLDDDMIETENFNVRAVYGLKASLASKGVNVINTDTTYELIYILCKIAMKKYLYLENEDSFEKQYKRQIKYNDNPIISFLSNIQHIGQLTAIKIVQELNLITLHDLIYMDLDKLKNITNKNQYQAIIKMLEWK